MLSAISAKILKILFLANGVGGGEGGMGWDMTVKKI